MRLGFRAYDPHDLLVHFVAERAGLYGSLEVTLVDLRRREQPHHAAVACGSALFAALAGAPIRVLLLAATAPMFWLYGAGSRIATYPPGGLRAASSSSRSLARRRRSSRSRATCPARPGQLERGR